MHDRAIADFDQAIRLRPQAPDSYVMRGVEYAAKGEPNRAILDFGQAIRLSPNKPYTYLERGDAFAAMGDLDWARGEAAQRLFCQRLGTRHARRIS
jgi:tetratricopeptide (TPR) repeat protein